MEKQKNVPQTGSPALRFPEFKGEWEKKKLGEVTNYTKGFAFKSEDYTNEGKRIIRVSDLGSDTIKNDSEKIFIDEDKIKELEKYKILKGEIIITTVGSKPEMIESAVGRGILISNSELGYLNQNLLKINVSNEIDNRFIFGLLKSKEYETHIKQIQRGNANQSNITVSDLFEFKIYLPSLPEQTKIANFLTAIDTKIQQLTQKKTLLEEYKKGVMQQLFSKKIRFKDENGKDYPDWEEKRLGEVTEINPKSKSLPKSFIYIDLESVVNGLLSKEEKIDKENAPSRAQRLVKKNDILFQMVRPYQKNNLYFNRDGEYVASTGYDQIRTLNNPKYIYQYLHLQEFVDKVIERCTGTSYPAINSTDLGNINILLPCLSEQTKIANFLSAIDTKIENVTKQIEQTQAYKKGLLQQMFI